MSYRDLKTFDLNFGKRDGGKNYLPGEVTTKKHSPEAIERYLKAKYPDLEKPTDKPPMVLKNWC